MTTPLPAWMTQGDKGILEKHLQHAIEAGHLWPAFQPVIYLQGKGLSSFEVLARWTDPQAGSLSPADFIPLLEEHRLVDLLFDAQVTQACLAAADWPGHFSLAFNISPTQLADRLLPQRLAALVEHTGFPLHRVQIEVTEGALQQSVEQVSAVLHAFEAQGVKIAIDDFGTGYSSLARLGDFPFHKLKIDARFVKDIDTTPSKRRIVAAIISLAQSLDMAACAEGVETEKTHSILKDLGCDLGQGWLYGKPMPAKDARPVAVELGDVVRQSNIMDTSLFQQHHQLETLYRTAPVGMAFLDTSFRHVRANDRFAAAYQITSKELEGKTIYQFMQRAMIEKAESALKRSIATDEPIVEDYEFGASTARVFCMRVKDMAGDIIGFSLVLIDTTERTKTEALIMRHIEHLRLASELHLSLFWAAEPNGRVNYISPTYTDKPHESMEDRIERWRSQIHPEDREAIKRNWNVSIANGQDFQMDFRLTNRRGNRWVRGRARPMRAKDGDVIRWYGIIADIDEVIEMETGKSNTQ